MTPPRILFVSHSATRTGAPLMLLTFLRWLRANSNIDISVLVVQEGELSSSFAEVGEVITMARRGDRPPERFLRRLGWATDSFTAPSDGVSRSERTIRLGAQRVILQWLRKELAELGPVDLVYLNSVHSAPALRLVPAGIPVMTHAHELGYQLDQVPAPELNTLRARTHRYVAAAWCVRDIIVERLGIEASAVDVCHEFIPIDDAPPDAASVAAIREELGLADDTLVVGSVGAVIWIKGPDLLVQVARRVLDAIGSEQRIVFLWMGTPRPPWVIGELTYDIDATGLTDKVRFIGARRDPRPVMALLDVLLLPSRSDPFPLVCLEAAALGKPIVCFASGGMREFLEPEERLVVPYLDIDSMARRLVELLRSESERVTIGRRLARRVRDRHSLEVGAPQLLGHIERVLSTTSPHDRSVAPPTRAV